MISEDILTFLLRMAAIWPGKLGFECSRRKNHSRISCYLALHSFSSQGCLAPPQPGSTAAALCLHPQPLHATEHGAGTPHGAGTQLLRPLPQRPQHYQLQQHHKQLAAAWSGATGAGGSLEIVGTCGWPAGNMLMICWLQRRWQSGARWLSCSSSQLPVSTLNLTQHWPWHLTFVTVWHLASITTCVEHVNVFVVTCSKKNILESGLKTYLEI